MAGITGINASSLSGINNISNLKSQQSTDDAAGFKNVLEELIDQTNQTDAEDQAENIQLMTGNIDNLHDVIISGEKADLALRLTTQVRNKVVDAYNEIMRMQI